MGITYLEIEIGHPERPKQTERLSFLIDSGATHSLVPRAILERLGIRANTTQKYQLANGEVITREKGYAIFRYNDHEGVSSVIFGESGDKTLLGVVTLEELGFMLDPVHHELRPLPMLL